MVEASFSGVVLGVALAVHLSELLFFERYTLATTPAGARQELGRSTMIT